MKKTFLFCLFCSIIALASCHKSSIYQFRGDYSFKTSGTVTIQRMALPFDSVTPPAITFTLPNEIGQLEISTLDKDRDSVVVIMNYFNDDVIVTHGICKDNELIMNSFVRNALNFSVDYQLNFKAPVKIRAKGQLIEDNTLIFNMSYSGMATVGPLFYRIEGDDIKMVAYRN